MKLFSYLGAFAAMALASRFGLASGTIYQWFPANQPESKYKTAWKLTYDYTNTNGGSPSNTLYIKDVYFSLGRGRFIRSYNPKLRKWVSGWSGDWIKVLDEARLADIFVAYNSGTTYYDITQFGFGLEPASQSDLGPACVLPGKVLDANSLLEVLDDSPRWKENAVTLRGQKMLIWATLGAANYNYIMEYGFRDDGVITLRLGATSHDIQTFDPAGGDIHIHTGLWRIQPAIGDPKNNSVYVISHKAAQGGGATIDVQPFNSGLEGGIVWNPEEFTSLRIENSMLNAHVPQADHVSYTLSPLRYGSLRSFGMNEGFTLKDFWVTRADPADPNRVAPEIKYNDLPTYTANPEPLQGHPVVIWHPTPVWHVPRDEDYGQPGYDQSKGVALTMWGGLELKPRNIFAQTPLYP